MSKRCQYCKYDNHNDDVHCAQCRNPIVLDRSGAHIPAPVSRNGHVATNGPSDGFIVGRTKVRVMRIEEDERTRKKTIRELHKGVVLDRTSSFVRVFNPAPVAKGGDISAEDSQKYPISSKNCWCEIVEQLDAPQAYKIPPLFR